MLYIFPFPQSNVVTAKAALHERRNIMVRRNEFFIRNACPKIIDPLKWSKIQEKMKMALHENENLADIQ